MSPSYSELQTNRQAMMEIRSWPTEQLIQELRNPVRATLLLEDGRYHLMLAEAIARLLEGKKGTKPHAG